MSEWRVKKGNTSGQGILVRDSNEDIVTNLATATAISFQIKTNKSDLVPLISKSLISGIEVDTPTTGYLRITLLPSETAIPVGKYFMGLQITWSASLIWEVIIEIENVETDTFRIRSEIVL